MSSIQKYKYFFRVRFHYPVDNEGDVPFRETSTEVLSEPISGMVNIRKVEAALLRAHNNISVDGRRAMRVETLSWQKFEAPVSEKLKHLHQLFRTPSHE